MPESRKKYPIQCISQSGMKNKSLISTRYLCQIEFYAGPKELIMSYQNAIITFT